LEWSPLTQDLYQKVAKLETKVEEHSKLLQKQQEKNDIQTELNTLLKLQIEANKEQNKTMEKFGETLNRIDTNLTHLNSKQELLDERVNGIEESLSGQKIDTVKLVKGIFSYVLTAAGGGLVLYVYIKLGIK
jgi:chromosome segregation ATPase